jgi:hypothetical protein
MGPRRHITTLSIISLLLLAPPASAAVRPFTDSYAAHYIDYTVSDCRTTLPLTGVEPPGRGHPVFVYLVGSGERYDGAGAPAILRRAAAKGFVAASVAYPDWQLYSSGIDGNSRCIFNPWSRASAISKLCARPTSDCGKGVVVAGFSQGGAIAVRAANYEYFMGADGYTSCSPDPPFDRTWLTSTTAPWALGPNLDWLRRRTG